MDEMEKWLVIAGVALFALGCTVGALVMRTETRVALLQCEMERAGMARVIERQDAEVRRTCWRVPAGGEP